MLTKVHMFVQRGLLRVLSRSLPAASRTSLSRRAAIDMQMRRCCSDLSLLPGLRACSAQYDRQLEGRVLSGLEGSGLGQLEEQSLRLSLAS